MDEEGAPQERVRSVLATFDAECVHAAVNALTPADVAALAAVLGVPRRLLQEDAAAARVLRRRVLSMSPESRPDVALMLSTACNEDTVASLGGRHENPTRDDMLSVLDSIVENHDARIVALMLASYVDGGAPCASVFADLLDSDPRFAVEALADLATIADPADLADPADPASSADSADHDPDRDARRRERKEKERSLRDRRTREAAALEAARQRHKDARRRARG